MEELKFLRSDDKDIVCLYLNIMQEKYGLDNLIDSLEKEKDFSLKIYRLNPNNTVKNSYRTNIHGGRDIEVMYKDDKFITISDYYSLPNHDYI
jgi:hypothetical protein